MVALTVEGTYENGQFKLEKPIPYNEAVRVVILVLEPVAQEATTPLHFSFYESLELTKDLKGNISDLIVEERRAAKW